MVKKPKRRFAVCAPRSDVGGKTICLRCFSAVFISSLSTRVSGFRGVLGCRSATTVRTGCLRESECANERKSSSASLPSYRTRARKSETVGLYNCKMREMLKNRPQRSAVAWTQLVGSSCGQALLVGSKRFAKRKSPQDIAFARFGLRP